MKVYYLGILRNETTPAVELVEEKDLSTWGRFTRGSVSEFMTLFSKTVAERTRPGARSDIEEQGGLPSLAQFSPPAPNAPLQILSSTSTPAPRASPAS
jgi:hypothetical protein